MLNLKLDLERIQKFPKTPIPMRNQISFPRSIQNQVDSNFTPIPESKSLPTLPTLRIGSEAKSFIDTLIEKYTHSQGTKGGYDNAQIATYTTSNKIYVDVMETTGNIPSARDGATTTIIFGKLFVFGGQCRERYNEMRVLNLNTGYWSCLDYQQGDPPPETRVGHTTNRYKEKLVVYGGRGPYNSTLHIRNCYPLVHFFDTLSRKWSTFNPIGKKPTARRMHGSSIIGNSMIVFGGVDCTGKFLNDSFVLSIEAMQWLHPKVDKVNRPPACHSFSMTAIYNPQTLNNYNLDFFNLSTTSDDKYTKQNIGVYIFGGITDQGISNEIWLLQPIRRASAQTKPRIVWEKLITKGIKPTPRYSHSAVAYQNKIYIIGGRNDSITGVSDSFFDEVCVFDTKVRYWYQLKLYGNPIGHRWGACAECYGSKILYFAGMSLQSYHDFTVYSLETDFSSCKKAIESWTNDHNQK